MIQWLDEKSFPQGSSLPSLSFPGTTGNEKGIITSAYALDLKRKIEIGVFMHLKDTSIQFPTQ